MTRSIAVIASLLGGALALGACNSPGQRADRGIGPLAPRDACGFPGPPCPPPIAGYAPVTVPAGIPPIELDMMVDDARRARARQQQAYDAMIEQMRDDHLAASARRDRR